MKKEKRILGWTPELNSLLWKNSCDGKGLKPHSHEKQANSKLRCSHRCGQCPAVSQAHPLTGFKVVLVCPSVLCRPNSLTSLWSTWPPGVAQGPQHTCVISSFGLDTLGTFLIQKGQIFFFFLKWCLILEHEHNNFVPNYIGNQEVDNLEAILCFTLPRNGSHTVMLWMPKRRTQNEQSSR